MEFSEVSGSQFDNSSFRPWARLLGCLDNVDRRCRNNFLLNTGQKAMRKIFCTKSQASCVFLDVGQPRSVTLPDVRFRCLLYAPTLLEHLSLSGFLAQLSPYLTVRRIAATSIFKQ